MLKMCYVYKSNGMTFRVSSYICIYTQWIYTVNIRNSRSKNHVSECVEIKEKRRDDISSTSSSGRVAHRRCVATDERRGSRLRNTYISIATMHFAASWRDNTEGCCWIPPTEIGRPGTTASCRDRKGEGWGADSLRRRTTPGGTWIFLVGAITSRYTVNTVVGSRKPPGIPGGCFRGCVRDSRISSPRGVSRSIYTRTKDAREENFLCLSPSLGRVTSNSFVRAGCIFFTYVSLFRRKEQKRRYAKEFKRRTEK